MTFAFISGPGPWLALAGITIALLVVDLKLFAPRSRADLPRGRVVVGRLARGRAAGRAARVGALERRRRASPTRPSTSSSARCRSTTCSSSCCCSATSRVPEEHRANLLFWGIVAALALRGLAILGGVALIEQFHFVIYILGALLLVLAWRILRGVEEGVEPDKNLIVRGVRKVFPVSSDFDGHHWFTKIDGKRARDADLRLPGRDRRRRHRVRGRLDPGRVRDHARLGADLDGQHLRPARPARAVRARRGPDPALPLPRRDDRGRARAGRASSC